MLSSSCRWSSATATAGRNRPSRHRSVQIKALQCMSSSPPAQGSSPRSFPSTDQPRARHTVHVVICHSHGWQQSVLLIPGQPRSKHRVHVAVTTGPRELTETLPPTRNATAQPGSSWPRRREAFLPLAKSYRMKGMPRASLHCRGRRGRHCREDCDGATARRRQRAEIMLVSRAVRCHPEE
jgi:hypothetical protein